MLGLAVLAVTGAVGCGDGSGDGTTSTTEPDPTVQDRVVHVKNGDTDADIPGAIVAPVFSSSPEPGTPVPFANGGFTIPGDATGVYVRHEPFGERFQAITPTTKETIRVDLYDPALQSPQYGDNTNRTRYNPNVTVPPPSGKERWKHTGKALIEFPPVVWQGTAVFSNNVGRVFAYDVRNPTRNRKGEPQPRWSVKLTKPGGLMAASPAIYPRPRGATVIVASMDGLVNSYNLRTAGRREAWKRPFSTGGRAVESSPLIVGDSVFVGDHGGSLYKLNAATGEKQCAQGANGAIKGSAAQYKDNIIFADYAGYVYSMRARDCQIVWSKHFGGRFYGGPAVQGSTIVIGNIANAVYGIDAETGSQIWRVPTGSMVYSSPAIARGVVYIGSYDHYLRALRLSDGKELWRYSVGGPVSGSATVIGDLVYVSRLAGRGQADATFAVDTKTRKVAWESQDGRYSPAVAAGKTLFIVGRTTLYAYQAP